MGIFHDFAMRQITVSCMKMGENGRVWRIAHSVPTSWGNKPNLMMQHLRRLLRSLRWVMSLLSVQNPAPKISRT